MDGDAAELNGVGAAEAADSTGDRKRLQATEDFRRVVEENLIDDSGFERGPVELASGLDHEGPVLERGEMFGQFAEIGAAAGAIEDEDANASIFESTAAFFRRCGSGENGDIAGGAGDDAGIEGNAEGGIGDDAQEGAATLEAGAIGQLGIVGERGTDAGEDGVGIVADFLDVRAGAFAGDPAGVVFGRGDLAVEGEGGFEGDEGKSGAHRMDE